MASVLERRIACETEKWRGDGNYNLVHSPLSVQQARHPLTSHGQGYLPSRRRTEGNVGEIKAFPLCCEMLLLQILNDKIGNPLGATQRGVVTLFKVVYFDALKRKNYAQAKQRRRKR